jgi:hypothetical protein
MIARRASQFELIVKDAAPIDLDVTLREESATHKRGLAAASWISRSSVPAL